MIEIHEAGVRDSGATALLRELNETLARLTGASGEPSFSADDLDDPHAVFVIACEHGAACGCGALRPLSPDTAELKRVYAHPNTKGVGTAIVQTLEEKAKSLDYTRLVLETRKINENAVAFYRKLGYTVCPNYGKYIGRDEAVCMEKKI